MPWVNSLAGSGLVERRLDVGHLRVELVPFEVEQSERHDREYLVADDEDPVDLRSVVKLGGEVGVVGKVGEAGGGVGGEVGGEVGDKEWVR